MAAAAAVQGHFVDIREWQSMKAVETITGRVVGAQPRRCRHRPDHPQAVPQAGQPRRLRRLPVLRLGQAARVEPAQEPGAGRRARTSAVAPAASTPPGRWRTTASRRSSRRASPTSSAPTAPRWGCCRCSSPPLTAPRSPRRGRPRSISPSRRSAGRAVTRAVRDRLADQAPAAQRARRHRGTLAEDSEAIDAYERDRQRSGPVTTAL